MEKKYRPMSGKIMVLPEGNDKVTEGGIIITGNGNVGYERGVVVSVGNNIDDVKAGDRIMYGQHGGTPIHVEDNDYLIMSIGNVLMVLE